MRPRCLIVALCVAACSAAPARDAPHPTRPLTAVPADASTAPGDAAVSDAVPGDAAEPACEPFDPKNPRCANDPRNCLHGLADCKCPRPPDVENPACWATMACPRVPDRRVRACRPRLPPCPDVDQPDPDNPNCPASSVNARVISVKTMASGDTLITIGAGTAQDLTTRWRATLLSGDSDDALPGGEVTILRVSRVLTVGTVHVTLDTVAANPHVRFERR